MARGQSEIFNNVMQVFKSRIECDGVLPVSVEVDLELPRGYIAKIKKVIFSVQSTAAAALSDQGSMRVHMALVNDPDDDETVEIPNAEVDHDVIADGCLETVSELVGAAYGAITHTYAEKTIDFDQELDIIVARPMRFNHNTNVDLNNNMAALCTVYYTLEKITSEQILELLDIL